MKLVKSGVMGMAGASFAYDVYSFLVKGKKLTLPQGIKTGLKGAVAYLAGKSYFNEKERDSQG